MLVVFRIFEGRSVEDLIPDGVLSINYLCRTDLTGGSRCRLRGMRMLVGAGKGPLVPPDQGPKLKIPGESRDGRSYS